MTDNKSSLLVVSTFAPQSLVEGTFREKVFKLFLQNLNDLTSFSKIKALLIGPESSQKSSESITFLTSTLPSKETKLSFLHDWILTQNEQFDFICRLDDDDFINEEAIGFLDDGIDFITDRKHTFYDIASGMISSQVRPWFANTTIMKWEHAFAEPWEKGKSLFFHYDHSRAWHRYADEQNLKVKYLDSKPLYLRLLSPFSITSSGIRDGVTNQLNIDWSAYFKYRYGFGNWRKPNGYEKTQFPISKLEALWMKSHGSVVKPSRIWNTKQRLAFILSRVVTKLKTL